MKKLSILFCTIVFFGALAAHSACSCGGVGCDSCAVPAPCDSCCPAAPAPCDTGDEVTCKLPICNLCECPCSKITKEEIYKKLCLTQCQIDQACALHEKYKSDTQCIRDSLKCEEDKLCALKAKCASKCEIKVQKKKVKELKNRLKCFCKDYEEQFLCLLTSEQQACYKKLKKTEKCKCKCKKDKCCN